MIMARRFVFPLSFSKLLSQLSSRHKNATEDSFPFICLASFWGEEKKCLMVISSPARHQTS